jgi:hypothetical protein
MATNEAERVQQLQRTLYRTAKQSKAVKFYSLYDKVWRNDVLWEAWKQVKANYRGHCVAWRRRANAQPVARAIAW